MEDDKLFKLWQKTDVLAESQLQKMGKQIEQANQTRSVNIMNQLLRGSIREIFWGVLIALIAAAYCRFNVLSLAIIAAAVLVSLTITTPGYLRLKTKNASINLQEVKSALSDYIHFMESYVRRLRLTVYLFVPIVFSASIIGTYLPDTQLNFQQLLVKIVLTMLIAAPFVAGFLFSEFKRYINNKYVPRLNDLKKMRDELERDESIQHY